MRKYPGLIIVMLIATSAYAGENNSIQLKLSEYATVRLTTDMTKLSEKEKRMIPILIEVSSIMDSMFWQEFFGDRDVLFKEIKDEFVRKFALINYGPWDRLDNNRPFIPGFGNKPAGNNLYPRNMTKDEYDRFADTNKTSRYTIIRRDAREVLNIVWYNDAFREEVGRAASLLDDAAKLAEDPGLKRYLALRAESFFTDDYGPSDRAWMDVKDSAIDFIVGPSEVADGLYDIKTAHEAIVMVKDREWSRKVASYMVRLAELHKELPVGEAFKRQTSSSKSVLSVCDAVYCAGDANCGPKTVAICLPSDANLRKETGAKRFLLKNVIKAKFDNIVVPLANEMVDPSQKEHVSFEAFFNNLMFLILSEIAQGPGVQQTVNGKGSVREALGEAAILFEEAKASILSVFFAVKIAADDKAGPVEDIFVTYMVNLFRSIRRGTESPDGKANMMSFNYFLEQGAFLRNPGDGKYKVDVIRARSAMNSWVKMLVEVQGNGDKARAMDLLKAKGTMGADIRADLERLKSVSIPKDVIYEQGLEVLGLGSVK